MTLATSGWARCKRRTTVMSGQPSRGLSALRIATSTRDGFDQPLNLIRIERTGRHLKFRAAAKFPDQKLALHLIGVRDQHTNRIRKPACSSGFHNSLCEANGGGATFYGANCCGANWCGASLCGARPNPPIHSVGDWREPTTWHVRWFCDVSTSRLVESNSGKPYESRRTLALRKPVQGRQ